MVAVPEIACVHPDGKLACPICVDEQFHHRRLFEKTFTENDIRESSRGYVKALYAESICPEAFLPPHASQHCYTGNLRFCDSEFNGLPMTFQKRGNKSYLTGGWGEYIRVRALGIGSTIAVDEYTSNGKSAERFFMIRSTKVFGSFFG